MSPASTGQHGRLDPHGTAAPDDGDERANRKQNPQDANSPVVRTPAGLDPGPQDADKERGEESVVRLFHISGQLGRGPETAALPHRRKGAAMLEKHDVQD